MTLLIGVARERIENQQTGTRQNILVRAEREHSADAPSFAAFARDLHGELNERLEDIRIVFGDLAKDGFKHIRG